MITVRILVGKTQQGVGSARTLVRVHVISARPTWRAQLTLKMHCPSVTERNGACRGGRWLQRGPRAVVVDWSICVFEIDCSGGGWVAESWRSRATYVVRRKMDL